MAAKYMDNLLWNIWNADFSYIMNYFRMRISWCAVYYRKKKVRRHWNVKCSHRSRVRDKVPRHVIFNVAKPILLNNVQHAEAGLIILVSKNSFTVNSISNYRNGLGLGIFAYQQDYAPVHTSRSTQEWLDVNLQEYWIPISCYMLDYSSVQALKVLCHHVAGLDTLGEISTLNSQIRTEHLAK